MPTGYVVGFYMNVYICLQDKQLTAKDVQNLRRQNNNLDSDRHERDKTLNHLRTRVAVLEQELKDKEQVSKSDSFLITIYLC